MRAWVYALPIVQGNFDIIHFEFSGLAVEYLDVLPLLSPARLVTSCRGAAEQIVPLSELERAKELRSVFERIDAVHCVSTDIKKTAEKYGLDTAKSFVISPAINLNLFHREATYPCKMSGPYKLISVGRLHWKKGYEFALIAVQQLIESGFEVEYLIIGEGDQEEKLRFLIDQLGLAENVTLAGRKSAGEVRKALEEADIFVLPSLSEGLSNAVLEAMAMEVPVISTTAGGMDEAIHDGEDGLLIPTMQPNALTSRIIQLLENYQFRKRLGEAGRKKVIERFNLDAQINQFINNMKI